MSETKELPTCETCGGKSQYCPVCVTQNLLREIRDNLELLKPSSSVADSDWIWSYQAPALPAFANLNSDQYTIATYEYQGPTSVDIAVPYDVKRPYVVIEPSRRSVELLDNITGLVLVAANPGQCVSAQVGEAASLRALIGPGIEPDRVTVRFSSRPLAVQPRAQWSDEIPVFARGVYGAGGAADLGIPYRLPNGVTSAMFHVLGYGSDAAATATYSSNAKMGGAVRGPGVNWGSTNIAAGTAIAGFQKRTAMTVTLGRDGWWRLEVPNTVAGVELAMWVQYLTT